MRSVANMTRQDARDFLALAHELNFRPRVRPFSLGDANRALEAVSKHETADAMRSDCSLRNRYITAHK